jgi:hypothetical protein
VDDDKFQNTDDLFDDELDEMIEGYCVRCRMSVDIIDPLPVWTRKGMPATRGECPVCAGTVFRMGKTDAHAGQSRPKAIEVGSTKRKRPKLEQDTVYINFAIDDEIIAEQLAGDLQKMGITAWMHVHDEEVAQVDWAGGVHPALKECSQMVFVLSPAALEIADVQAAWQFFKTKRKTIVIAQVDNVEPPDPIRRSPRYDFAADYKAAFRQMMQALS